MSKVTSIINNTFTSILLKSDTSTMEVDFPVLEVYIDNKLTYTLVVGGTSTIGGTTYETTPGATDLTFTETTTTVGTEYVFNITPLILGINTLKLPDGVYTFKLIDGREVEDLYTYQLAYYKKQCCMADQLNTAYYTSLAPVISKAEENVIRMSSLIESTIASCAIGDPVNANKKFKLVTLLCSDCGCK
tara:strand:- start:904 stop:1470 length:567 start_codon:yes stop_codon:yes gene_type:complete